MQHWQAPSATSVIIAGLAYLALLAIGLRPMAGEEWRRLAE